MSKESEEAFKDLEKNEQSEKSDFIKLFADIFSKVDWILVLILFILGLIIFSTTFVEEVLLKVPDAVQGDCPTTKGTIIQLATLIGGYVISDILHKYKVI